MKQTITWHEITNAKQRHLPDADLDVLVYDSELDDTVIASVDVLDGDIIWIENSTGDQLPSPKFWAEKPFPTDGE